MSSNGSLWVEGDSIHYISESGDEYKQVGDVVDSSSSGEPGSLWVEDARIHYVDESQTERRASRRINTSGVSTPSDGASVWIEGDGLRFVGEDSNKSEMFEDVAHDDVSFNNFSNHSDSSFSDFSNHSDGSFSDFSDHNDSSFSNFSDHADGNTRSDAVSAIAISNSGYDFANGSLSRSEPYFGDVSGHDDSSFSNFSNHSDSSFSNFSNHSDSSFSNFSNHSDRSHDDAAHQDQPQQV
jgi:hypothetical protein